MSFARAAAFLERVADVELGCLEGGNEAKGDAGERRDADDEGEDDIIDAHLIKPWRAFGKNREQNVGQPDAEKQTSDPADRGKQNAFSEHLPNDSCAASTHGRADGNFFLAGGGAAEEQVGDVRAGDE